MTPAEIRAVGLLDSLREQGAFKANMNQRLFVERIAGRAKREPEAALTASEARYLRSIGEAHGIKFDGDDHPLPALPQNSDAAGEAGGDRDPAEREGGASRRRPGRADQAGAAGDQELGSGAPPEASPAAAVLAAPPAAGEAQRRSVELSHYDAAKRALAEAVRIDEVKSIHDRAAAIQAYARMAEDPELEANAAELRLRAEHRLGQLIGEAKQSGRLAEGRPRGSSTKKNASKSEEFSNGEAEGRFKLSDLGVDHKLSSRAQTVATLDLESTVVRLRKDVASGKRGAASSIVREAKQGGPVNGARSVMGSRVEPPDSLDYFPTPPWSTRSLIEIVLPAAGVPAASLKDMLAEEPCCGEGHIAGVLEEYFRTVQSSDIFDYSCNGRSPPGWVGTRDFINGAPLPDQPDWIITNTPFEEKALACALQALGRAKIGVALFVQLRWLETIERYEQLFKDRPPTLVGLFVERVNLCKGRWDPKGGTATSYVWLVWLKDTAPKPLFWIPPGQREAMAREDDVARFTASPCFAFGVSPSVQLDNGSVVPRDFLTPEERATEEAKPQAWRDPSDGEVRGLEAAE